MKHISLLRKSFFAHVGVFTNKEIEKRVDINKIMKDEKRYTVKVSDAATKFDR